MINLTRNKNICCGLKKVVAKRRARVNFEQQSLALLLVFHQTHNLSRNKFARARANQPISALHFFNPQQMFLLRIKLIAQGEKRETSTKTCSETMLRDKLRVFVSRISPPLGAGTPYESAVAPKSLRSRTLLSLVRHMSGAAFGSGLKQIAVFHLTSLNFKLQNY